jgi:hypothetical protein
MTTGNSQDTLQMFEAEEAFNLCGEATNGQETIDMARSSVGTGESVHPLR